MARYIDADKITRDTLDQYGWFDHDQIEQVMSMIEDASTENVQPVTHGHWVNFYTENSNTMERYCSVCKGHLAGSGEYPVSAAYCPHCGAKMDG